MKIAYLVPGMMDSCECRRREGMLQSWAFPGTEILVEAVQVGPLSIESMYEEFLCIPELMKLVAKKEEEGYDAVILGCAGDPGLSAAREITQEMVVVGPGQSAFLMAAGLSHFFTVISTDEAMEPSYYDQAYGAGVSQKLRSVHSVETPVNGMLEKREEILEQLTQVGKTLLIEEKTECLVFGCMSLGFLDLDQELSHILGIPIINPAKVALKMAESLCSIRLKPSKKAWPIPAKLRKKTVQTLEELYCK